MRSLQTVCLKTTLYWNVCWHISSVYSKRTRCGPKRTILWDKQLAAWVVYISTLAVLTYQGSALAGRKEGKCNDNACLGMMGTRVASDSLSWFERAAFHGPSVHSAYHKMIPGALLANSPPQKSNSLILHYILFIWIVLVSPICVPVQTRWLSKWQKSKVTKSHQQCLFSEIITQFLQVIYRL